MKTIKKSRILGLLGLAFIAILCFTCAFNVNFAQATTVAPVMEDGASIRLMDSTKTDGIRFTMNMDKDGFESIYSDASFKSGIIILPTTEAGSDNLTVDTADIAVADTTQSWFVVEGKTEDDYSYSCRAVVTNIGSANYSTALSARGYVYTDTLGYVYTEYDVGKNSRSMIDVAQKVIDDDDSNFATLQGAYAYLSKGDIKDGHIYKQTDDIYTLPAFGSSTPDYTVASEENSLNVLNGNKIKLDTAGEFTATFGSNEVDFTVYSESDWANVIAPMNTTQYASQIVDINSEYAAISYDSTMEAYRVDFKGTAGGGLQLIPDCELLEKVTAGANGTKYFAFDIYLGSNYDVTKNIWLGFENFNGTDGYQQLVNCQTTSIYIYQADSATRITNFTTMKTDTWYKIFVEANGFADDGRFKDLIMFRATSGSCYVKNLRFEAEATNPQPVDPNMIAKFDSSADDTLLNSADATMYLAWGYDATMNACKLQVKTAGAALKTRTSGELAARLLSEASNNKYFVLDMYFETGYDLTQNLWFHFNNFAGTLATSGSRQTFNDNMANSICVYQTGTTNRITSKSGLANDTWYTVYVEMGGYNTWTSNNVDLINFKSTGNVYIRNLKLVESIG